MTINTKSAREILSEATAQIDVFERQVVEFFNSQPYQRVIEHNAKTRVDTHKIKLVREIPGQFRTSARHIASDIRSSLDHIGYAAAIATGKSNPRRTYFPFARSASEENNIKNSNCADFPEDIFKVFWSFKPYLGGDDTLWALNEIANCNKHRTIVPIGHGLAGGQIITNFRCDGMCYEMAFPPFWDRERNEAILCIVDSCANTSYSIQLGFDICFGDINVLNRHPVIPVLKYLRDIADKIICTAEKEGIRIGIFS